MEPPRGHGARPGGVRGRPAGEGGRGRSTGGASGARGHRAAAPGPGFLPERSHDGGSETRTRFSRQGNGGTALPGPCRGAQPVGKACQGQAAGGAHSEGGRRGGAAPARDSSSQAAPRVRVTCGARARRRGSYGGDPRAGPRQVSQVEERAAGLEDSARGTGVKPTASAQPRTQPAPARGPHACTAAPGTRVPSNRSCTATSSLASLPTNQSAPQRPIRTHESDQLEECSLDQSNCSDLDSSFAWKWTNQGQGRDSLYIRGGGAPPWPEE